MPEADIGRVKRNIGKMIEGGASESEIDFYINSEGTSLDAIRSFKAEPAQAGPRQAGSAVEEAIRPITSYPEVYSQMNRESREQMGRGLEQLTAPTGGDLLGSAGAAAKGLGNLALGGLGYIASPIAAGLRTTLGNPLEETTGVPKEITETISSLALPIPKRIPTFTRATERAAPTVEELKTSYRAAKDAPDVAAVKIAPEATVRNAEITKAELNTEWLDPELAPKTFHILDKLTRPAEGSYTTMANVDSARRRLGAMAGRGDEEAAAAGIAKKKLDEWVGGMSPADTLAGDPRLAQSIMQEGRGDYAAAKLGEAFDKKIAQAELRSSTTHSGQNLDNLLRQKAEQFLNSDASRNLTATQRAAVEKVAEGTTNRNIIRFAGKFLGGGGGLGALASGGVGAATLGPAGVAAPAVGFALNKLGSFLTSRQAAKVSEMIRADSPLGRQMRGPLEDFGKIAQEAEVSPTARNLSRLSLASRNLSTNLKDVDISIAPNDLLKSLFGKPAEADE